MSYSIHMTRKSGNGKVGPIPVTTTDQNTCPVACPLNTDSGGGCYANGGPLKLHWNKVTSGERGSDVETFASKVAALPDGQLWRHNQAGDLPGDGHTIDRSALDQIASANTGRRGFTYTHYDAESDMVNREAIRAANRAGFTVNLSSDNPQHADTLADLEAGPVVTLLPGDQTENTVTPAGRKVIVCPATIKDNVTCATCGLCQRQTSGKAERPVVGFPVHGTQKRKAAAVAERDSSGYFGIAV